MLYEYAMYPIATLDMKLTLSSSNSQTDVAGYFQDQVLIDDASVSNSQLIVNYSASEHHLVVFYDR